MQICSKLLAEKPKKLQVFTETTGVRDDWLHRGLALADMDLYQYSVAIERVRIPRALARKQDAGNVFPFDAHYRLANNFCQKIAALPRTEALVRVLRRTYRVHRNFESAGCQF